MTADLKEEDTQQQTQDQQQTEGDQPEKQQTDEEINWKKFREQKKEAERKAREEAERARQAEEQRKLMEETYTKLFSQQKPQQSDDEEEDDWDDQKKKSKKNSTEDIETAVEKVLRKQREQEERERKEREMRELPQRLKRDFSDFDLVCNEENVNYLEFKYPEIASGFAHMPDGYDKWACIYKAVKRLVKNPDTTEAEKKLEQNSNKPRSSATTGNASSQDDIPSFVSAERRAQNWERMRQALKS